MAQLSWFDFPAEDAARALTFYATLFGWQFDQVEGFDYYTIGGDAPIGGMYPATSAPRGITVYFKVEDVDAAAAQVAALGGTVDGRAEDARRRYARCRDTEGNAFTLYELADEAAVA
jgi:predicted enzyme related to lactoylglutathione lyase